MPWLAPLQGVLFVHLRKHGLLALLAWSFSPLGQLLLCVLTTLRSPEQYLPLACCSYQCSGCWHQQPKRSTAKRFNRHGQRCCCCCWPQPTHPATNHPAASCCLITG